MKQYLKEWKVNLKTKNKNKSPKRKFKIKLKGSLLGLPYSEFKRLKKIKVNSQLSLFLFQLQKPKKLASTQLITTNDTSKRSEAVQKLMNSKKVRVARKLRPKSQIQRRIQTAKMSQTNFGNPINIDF